MLHAEFSLAPLLLFAAFALISNAAKKKQRGGPRPAAGAAPPAQRADFMSDLRRAMEDLQRAQLQQQRQPAAQAPTPAQLPATERKAAADWLDRQKQLKAVGPGGRVRSVRRVVPLEDDDADKSSETDVPVAQDYDDEAERIATRRVKAAESRVVRVDESVEELTSLQKARREARDAISIGGAAEHAAWHEQVGGTGAAPGAAARKSKLGRFADGSARSAIVLGEILGPPPGLRD